MPKNTTIIIECFDHMETYNKEASVPYYFMKGKKETPNSCLAAEKRYEKKLKN